MAEPSVPGATGTGAPRVWRAGDSPASPWNVANVLTIVRILLAPVFVVLLAADDGADGPLRYAAAALFIVAIATDGVDGHIARSRNLVTDLGKLLDPIADTVLTGAALVMLSVLGELPWWVTIVILVRELGITAYRFAVLRDHAVAASRGGKIKKVAQAVAISVALLPLWDVVGDGMHVVKTFLMSIAFVLTVRSGLDYMRQALRAERA